MKLVAANRWKILLVLLLSWITFAQAQTVDIAGKTAISLLEHSRVCIDENNRTLEAIKQSALLKPYTRPYINNGMRAQAIWIGFTLANPASVSVQKTLVLSSPMLEEITLYPEATRSVPIRKGRMHPAARPMTLLYHFDLELPPGSTRTYYLRVQSHYLPVAFSVTLQDPQAFRADDHMQLMIATMIISIILALSLYNFLLFLRTRDRGYFFYSLYLFALILQQATYLGLTPIVLSPDLGILDVKMSNLKDTAIILASACFALNFLKIPHPSKLFTIYLGMISLAILQLLISYVFGIHSLLFLSLIAMVYVPFTLAAGILSYRRGNRQARLFVAGFVLLFVSYIMMASDALGVSTLMLEHRSLLAWGTTIDALILSLAFADRYMILQQEKEAIDQRILSESQNRETIIQSEVTQKTSQLTHALETKEMLLQEVHHRVKNNLQIILSMIRLQNDESKSIPIREQLTDLEHRIGTIATTYMMLIETDDLQQIDMANYIRSLLDDLSRSYRRTPQTIRIETDLHATMPLKEAVYVGLIINELITNAYQHAFGSTGGTIRVALSQQEDRFTLKVEDDGSGYIPDDRHRSLGLQLIHALVYEQLEGILESETHPHTKYTIRFIA